MKKTIIYANVFARFIILLLGYLFAALFFLFQILGAIGDIYLSSLFSFVTSTKTLLSNYEKDNK